jgi:preprotein translocase subunit SecG
MRFLRPIRSRGCIYIAAILYVISLVLDNIKSTKQLSDLFYVLSVAFLIISFILWSRERKATKEAASKNPKVSKKD